MQLDIRITSMYPPTEKGGIRAYASATIDGGLGIRGIKIVEGGESGLFVSMPSRKTVDGYKDICFPVTAEFREELHGAVMGAYRQALGMSQETAMGQDAPVQEAVSSQGEMPEQGEAPQEGQQMAGM